jgi:hypothetical protein
MATSLKIDDMLKSRVHHLAGQRRRSPHWMPPSEQVRPSSGNSCYWKRLPTLVARSLKCRSCANW